MVRNKAPIRYTIQTGGVGSGLVGAGGGGGVGISGGAGALVSAEGVEFIGGGVGAGAGGIGGGGVVGVADDFTGEAAVGADSVVKAPAALQALWVSELMALTFQ